LIRIVEQAVKAFSLRQSVKGELGEVVEGVFGDGAKFVADDVLCLCLDGSVLL